MGHGDPQGGVVPRRPRALRDGDWREDRALAWTIIPWLLEWLVEYEVWLVTGEWCGGGVAHAGQAVGDHDTRTLGDGAPTVTGEAAHD